MCSIRTISVVVNPLNSDGAALMEVSMVELQAYDPCVLQEHVDRQFFLAFNFNAINNTLLYRPDHYPYNAVSKTWRVKTPQVNNLTFVFPASPPLSQPLAPQPTLCPYGQEAPCDGDHCSCTYVLEAALGEEVEMVLVDEGTTGAENHPFHLHGYSFHVVAMGHLGGKTTLAEVKALEAAGGITRKLTNAVKKDSVTIPDGGYTVIRFTADNPGWWLMHCHLTFHSELGMAAVLHVGNPSDLPQVPQGFPACGTFMPQL
nr:laccase-6-like [Procambarus clarkii]